MKRHLRHILSPLSALVLVFVAIFMVLPHDVCISKVVAQELCPCSSKAAAEVCCCGNPSTSLCGSDETSHTAPESPDNSGSACFSISSDQTVMTGAERAPSAAPVLFVMAVLPLPLDLSVGQPAIARGAAELIPGRDDVHLHRENCVFLI